MKTKRYFLALVLCASIGTIFANMYTPTEADATNANVSLEVLNEGRELYIDRCGKCHDLYQTSEYTKEKWAKIMNKMQKPAKITDEQKELIIKYINTNTKLETVVK